MHSNKVMHAEQGQLLWSRLVKIALIGSQKVTIHEPENINGWTFEYYSFHAVLQRKFWLMVRNNNKKRTCDISLITFGFYEHM